MENRAYKYRIYPNEKQRKKIEETFGCCRFIWNKMLTDKIDHYKKTGKNLTTRPAMYKEEYPFLKEVDSLALSNVQLNLQKAYQNYFNDKRIGFPKYKSKEKEKKKYTTNNQKGTIQILGQYIRLPIIGLVSGKIHRKAPEEWKLKSATISKENGKYYCSVLYEYVKKQESKEIELKDTVGIIIDKKGYCVTSEGKTFSLCKRQEKAEERILILEEKINKKTAGSNNRRRLENELKNLRIKTYNQNQDDLHKKTAELTEKYNLICIVKPEKNNENHKRVKTEKQKCQYSNIDTNIESFITMLTYKQTDKGGYVYLNSDEKIQKNTYKLFDVNKANETLAANYLKEKGYLMLKAELDYMKAVSKIPE